MSGSYYILILCAATVVVIAVRLVMRAYARKQVICKSTSKKIEEVNKMLAPCGLEYNQQEDIVHSSMYSWQRKFGYCRLYDEQAAKMNMILDCEPICFTCRGRRWMIELWKGQYAFATGAEIGIYVSDQKEIQIPNLFEGTFYECAGDDERIKMKFALVREGYTLFQREDYHWWLTGFSIGTYSRPEQLVMYVELEFQDYEMRDAFLDAVSNMGYGRAGIQVSELAIGMMYDRPFSRQPKRCRVMTLLRQTMNLVAARNYNRTTKSFVTTLDKLTFFKYYYPITYRVFTHQQKKIRMDRVMKKTYKKIRRYIR